MKRHCSTYNILASNRQQTYNSYYEKFADGTVKCIDEEIPFEIPNGWDICRLNDLALYRKGPFGSSLTKSMFVPKSDSSVKVYEQKNTIQKDYRLGDYYISQDKFNGMLSFIVEPGDLIVSCAGTIGETYCLPDEAPIGIINQALMRVKLYDSQLNSYWQLYFKYILNNESQMKGSGSAIKNIPPFEYLKSIIVVLPPLAEQKRIVEELQFLNMLSENYDKLQAELNNLNLSIKDKIRKSILQEAIQGKLIPQDPNDEPASVLLERIRAEKERLIKEQKIKRDKNESVIYKGDDNSYYEIVNGKTLCINDEIPFDIPESWTWVRGKSVFLPMESTHPEGEQFCYVDVDAVHNKQNTITRPKHLQSNQAPSRATRKLHTSDILFSLVRPYLRNIALVDATHSKSIASTGFYVITPNESLYPQYVFYLMLSSYVIDGLNQFMKGDNSPSINNAHIENWLYPLPPLVEQRRIVDRIKELSAHFK